MEDQFSAEVPHCQHGYKPKDISGIGARKDTPVTISDEIEQITKYSLSMPECEQKMEAEETGTNRSF